MGNSLLVHSFLPGDLGLLSGLLICIGIPSKRCLTKVTSTPTEKIRIIGRQADRRRCSGPSRKIAEKVGHLLYRFRLVFCFILYDYVVCRFCLSAHQP